MDTNSKTRSKSNFFAHLFGQFSWKQPQWLLASRQKIKPAVAGAVLVGLIILSVATYFGYQWYLTLPKPDLITASFTAPAITPVDEEPTPQPLTINFSKNVAPLDVINKEIHDGVSIKPEINGAWFWSNGTTLTFTPKANWAAGQKYTVSFAKNLVADHVKLAHWSQDFATAALTPTITNFHFYQDPTNPQLKQVVATLNFNYPVDASHLADYISLRLQALKNDQLDLAAKNYRSTLTFDKYQRTAYLTSEALTLDQVARYLQLTINKGVPAAKGNSTLTPVSQTVLIPDVSSFFKITAVKAQIIRDDKDIPGQVLLVETTAGVTTADLQKALHVYQLPVKKSAATDAKESVQVWNAPGEVTTDVLATAKPVNLQAIPTDQAYAVLHSFKFNADGNSQLYIKLDKGIAGYGDFKLAQDYITLATAPVYPQEITFLHPGALMALSSEKKLSVLVRGIPAVKFEFARVFPSEINHLVSQTEGKFANPKFINYSFNQNNISEIFSEVQQFNNTDPSHVQYTALDFSKYLAKQTALEQHGLFLLRAVNWNVENNSPGEIESKRLVLITDMGLLVKDNGDGTHDVFVQSIANGTPVGEATVEVLGKNGLPILTRTTDATGHVNFPSLQDFKDDREPTVYVAHHQGDLSFIPYTSSDRQLNYSKFNIDGVISNIQANNLTAFVFTDRGIYRPGDPIHAAAIVKQQYLQSQPAGIPLETIITDPRGMTVFDQKIALPLDGFFAVDYKPADTAPTGQYTINIYIVKDGHASDILGSATVQVHEFLPDRMKITTQLVPAQTNGWVTPDNLTAQVHLQNLFGTSAENRRVTGRIELTPQALKFDQYKDFIFIDPLLDPKKEPKTFSEDLADKTTDAQGNVTFNLNLARFDKATYQLTFYTQGFEADGGRSVSTQATQLVTPLSYLIGYKPDGDLTYIKHNSDRSVRFMAINSQLKPMALSNLHLSLVEQHTITTLVKKPDGTFAYQTQIQEVPVSSSPLNILISGTDYKLPTTKIGNYILRLTDANNAVICKVNFSVVGDQQGLAKQAELTVKLNKAEYLPGEDIELQITAPYTGAGLISLERDKVYAYNWFKTNSSNSIQKIHLPADFRGNGYLVVTFVRAWDSNEIFLSPLSYTVVPFTVSHQNQTVNIKLEAPTHVRPGEILNINYSTDKPGKIIVYAVDEGILQVTDYPTPDPLAYFFRKSALEVMTQQIVDQILPDYLRSRELSAIGGDGSEKQVLNNINPFKRKTDLPVVYWSGIIEANTTPQKLTYLVPDYFNGALRLMAVAVADNSAGSADQKVQVSGDFVIDPNVPTFVAPEDEFEVSLGVTNNVKNSGNNATVQLNLAPASQFEVLGPAQQSIVIPEGRERTAKFKLRAKDLLGSAQLNFTAKLGDKISNMHSTLSLRPAIAFNTKLISGFNASKTNTVAVSSDLYPQYRNLTAELSLSPLIFTQGLQRYLDNNPFLCTEQLVSKGFALLALSDSKFIALDKNLVNERFNSVLQMLRERELDSGAFSYWPGSLGDSFSSRFASVYAVHFLTEAKERGYPVPPELLANGLAYLQSLVTQDINDFDSARLQAYAIYILTRNEIVTTNYITNLQLYLEKTAPKTWRPDLTGVYLAASYQMLKNSDEANRLITQYNLNASIVANSDFYTNLGNNAQYLAILARYFPQQLQKLKGSVLLPITNSIADNSYNTLSAAYSALALSAYSQAFAAPVNVPLSLSEIIANGQVRQLADINNNYLTAAFSPEAQQLRFSADSPQGYFYQITQAGFAKNLPTKVVSNGLEIYREYRLVNTKNAISSTTLGTEIEVHLQLRALDNRSFDNIAVIDLLPGGFEVVRDSVPKEGIDYADIREDRVTFFTSVSPDNQEIVYHIKAVNPGIYTVPPAFAVSMYNSAIQANGVATKFTVQ